MKIKNIELKNQNKNFFFYINDTDIDAYLEFRIDAGIFGGEYLYFRFADFDGCVQTCGLPLRQYKNWGKPINIKDSIINWVLNLEPYNPIKCVKKEKLKKFLKENFNIIGE
tara:strand:+ start:146 stop:478 length:333 start_codon:yes stop_codon:yes gene_type:complete